MPSRAEASRHRFDLALIQPAAYGVEVDFHEKYNIRVSDIALGL